MGRVYVLIGKSSSGKDTIYKMLQENSQLHLKTVVGYTTRPIREGEKNGREYFFVSEEERQALLAAGKVVESRTYHTVHGDWHYFTADDGQISVEENAQDALFISTLAGYEGLCRFYGKKNICPIYVEVEDGMRLKRAIEREMMQKTPKYQELCRRFLADSEDFSEERLLAAGIMKRYQNNDLEACIAEITEDILRNR